MSVIVLLIAAGGTRGRRFPARVRLGRAHRPVRRHRPRRRAAILFDDSSRPRCQSASEGVRPCPLPSLTHVASAAVAPTRAVDTFRLRQRDRPPVRRRHVAWGIVAFLVGLIVALKLVFPDFLGGIPAALVRPAAPAAHQRGHLRVRRQRDLRRHLLLAAAAVQGADVQRSAERASTSGAGSSIIVAAAITLPLGLHDEQGIRRARVADRHRHHRSSGWSSASTSSARSRKRRERHLYVAIWFYIATIITVAMLHVVNSLALPVSLLKSYSMYAGVQDALVQWWYGHNAVAFFLTTPFLGIMYYFLPEGGGPAGVLLPAVDHPLLVAGLHLHLGRPAPPALHGAAGLGAVAGHGVLDHADGAVLGRHDQRPAHAARRLGQACARIRCSSSSSSASPSTAWRRSKGRCCRSRPSTRSRTTPTGSSATSTPARWAGMVPGVRDALLARPAPLRHEAVLAARSPTSHFWLATLGILFYVVPMYVGGITQGLMWREFTPDGTLRYPNFLETRRRASCRCTACARSAARSTSSARLVAVYNL